MMTQIEDEKLQYDIDREAARISALLSSNIAKYEYLTGEEILPLIKNKQQRKLNLFILLWEKLLRNKKKTMEDQGKKQIDALKTQD